jgi:hypothetical protein
MMQIGEVDKPMRRHAASDAQPSDFKPGRFEIFRIRKHRARRRQQNSGEKLAAAETRKCHW